MQGDQPDNQVHIAMRGVLEEIRRCRSGASSWGGTHAPLLRLSSAAHAAPPEQQTFPSGALEELADSAACNDPGSDAAIACVAAIGQLVCRREAHLARQQLLQSEPALRCESACCWPVGAACWADHLGCVAFPAAGAMAGSHALPPAPTLTSPLFVAAVATSLVLRVMMHAPVRTQAFHVAAHTLHGLLGYSSGRAQVSAAVGGVRVLLGRLLTAADELLSAGMIHSCAQVLGMVEGNAIQDPDGMRAACSELGMYPALVRWLEQAHGRCVSGAAGAAGAAGVGQLGDRREILLLSRCVVLGTIRALIWGAAGPTSSMPRGAEAALAGLLAPDPLRLVSALAAVVCDEGAGAAAGTRPGTAAAAPSSVPEDDSMDRAAQMLVQLRADSGVAAAAALRSAPLLRTLLRGCAHISKLERAVAMCEALGILVYPAVLTPETAPGPRSGAAGGRSSGSSSTGGGASRGAMRHGAICGTDSSRRAVAVYQRCPQDAVLALCVASARFWYAIKSASPLYQDAKTG